MKERATAAAWPTADPDAFRAAMAHFPAGVVVVTTRDSDGEPRGFTATSFCSVSLRPPLVLACLNERANSFPTFTDCDEFAVSVLTKDQGAIATRFATSGCDKFGAGDIALTPRLLPVVADALCELDCRIHDRHRAGDHVILVGAVIGVRMREGEPLLYHNRAFRPIQP